MNKESFKGRWKEIKGKAQKQWGKVTNDEWDKIQGDYNQFVGKIQQKYGYSKEETTGKVNQFLKGFNDTKDATDAKHMKDSKNVDSKNDKETKESKQMRSTTDTKESKPKKLKSAVA